MTAHQLGTLGAAYTVFCALYLGASAASLREPIALTPSPLDAWVPFLGWSIAVYLSQFALLGVVFWRAAGSPAWDRSLRSMLVATLTSAAVFVALPTRLDRPPLPDGGVIAAAYSTLYLFDPPTNCFPSLHVSLATLGALSFWPERRRLTVACLGWAALVTVSTLTTRQHVLLDVAGGAAVALFAHAVTRWWEQRSGEGVGDAPSRRAVAHDR